MDRYRLTEDRFQAVFLEAVEAPALAIARRVGKPQAIFLGGQPGCGKNTAVRSCDREFGDDGCVHVDVDRVNGML